MMEALRTHLIHQLKKPVKGSVQQEDLIPAAVFVPLFRKNSSWHLLLTSRSAKVRYHKKQISFPGGMYNREDGNLLTTALRETEEELGIKASDIEVWGQLEETPTPTRFLITPFVGTFPYPYQLRPSADEIDHILEIPISHFIDTNPAIQMMEFLGKTHEIPFYRANGRWIWGATGRIVRQLTSLMADA